MQKKFLLGETWLYFKVYAGSYILEELVPNVLYKLVNILSKRKLIDKFFFVKYNDDEGQHTRIRFQQLNLENTGIIIKLINEHFSNYLKNRIITNLVYDTYSREIDRYSVEHIEDFEFISFISSKLILSQAVKKDENPLTIVFVSVKIMDEFLNYLGFSINEKHNIYESYYKQYAQEFSVTHKMKEQLSIKYKKYGQEIERKLNSNLQYLNSLKIPQRNTIINTLNKLSISYLENKQKIYPIILGVIHLHYNRTFVSQPRENELVLYFILSRVYKTQMFKKITEKAE